MDALYSEAWIPDRAGKALRFSGIYYATNSQSEQFAGLSGSYTFSRGVGLPGLAWESRTPVWFEDVSRDSRFLRASAAARLGVRSGFAVGVPDYFEPEVPSAVLVFFFSTPRERDPYLLHLGDLLATQVTLALARRKHAEELDHLRQREADAGRALETLLQNLNHELRTPLTSILSLAERMREGDGPWHEDEPTRLLENAQRMRHALDALDEFAKRVRPRAARGTDNRGFTLGTLLQEVALPFREAAAGKAIELVVVCDDEGVALPEGSEVIRQVLRYLLDNAITFTSEGRVSISGVHAPQEGEVRFEVSDTGCGIPPEKHAHVFDPFRQASEGLSRPIEGLGLGLTLARRMVHSLSGRLVLDSAVGRGTTVTVSIPLTPAPSIHEPKSDDGRVEPEAQHISGERKSALIVEDNAINALLMEQLLREAGFSVARANNGETAVRRYEEHRPALVLMDINLGAGIDGVEAMKQIRAIAVAPAPRIVAVTGYSGETERERFLREGFDDYLTKPFLKHELLAVSAT